MAWWSADQELLNFVPIALVIFPICGYFWGAVMWRGLQRLREESISPADGADADGPGRVSQMIPPTDGPGAKWTT